MNERAAASDHTSVWVRRTGMPSIPARSARSALARMAMPTSVKRRNGARATSTTGATISARRSLLSKSCEPSVRWRSKGAATVRSAKVSVPHRRGSRSPPTMRSWDRPIVATMSSRRGLLKNRRMMSISTSAPSTSEATRPIGTANQNDSPEAAMRPTTSIVGTAPRSPCAKLSARLAR